MAKLYAFNIGVKKDIDTALFLLFDTSERGARKQAKELSNAGDAFDEKKNIVVYDKMVVLPRTTLFTPWKQDGSQKSFYLGDLGARNDILRDKMRMTPRRAPRRVRRSGG